MPQKRSRNLRKKGAPDSKVDDEWANNPKGQNGADEELTIEEIQYLQKQRSRQHGLSVEELNKVESKRKKKKLKSSGSEEKASKDSKDDGDDGSKQTDIEYGIKKPSVLGTFTTQTNVLDVNKHMMSYIEENVKKHRESVQDKNKSDSHGNEKKDGGADPAKDHDKEDRGASKDLKEDIYQIPDHLRLTSEKPVKEGNLSLSTAMLTSIPEVDLGMDTRIKNIEMTEKAKRDLAEKEKKEGVPPEDDMLARLRYQQYRDLSERRTTATDWAVAERFKQRLKR
ncbi:hypothetical protein H4219_000218 [Mycoemilia scoparia]|uniref:Uncharacterized protein n=1 Tax=Mycoemilia scoparia TaxID=417184 RepID=A0A9W8A9L9_9FUNG|nr:hypothetical protein H4219_000218 [Mycoemilia scoparia]